MPRIFPVIALTCLLAFCLAAGCTVQVDDDGSGAPFTPVISSSVRVVRIVDGDTIRVAFPDGSQETVRILGIDTPEKTVDPTVGSKILSNFIILCLGIYLSTNM